MNRTTYITIQIYLLLLNLLLPTSLVVFLFLFSEIIGIFLLKRKLLDLLSIATISYNLFFVIPYIINLYFPLEELSPYSVFLMVPEYYDKAIFYFIIFKSTYNIAFAIFSREKLEGKIEKKEKLSIKIPYPPRAIIYIFSILLFILQIFVGVGFYNLLQMIREGSRFLLSNPTVYNMTYSILFLIFVYGYILYKENRFKIYDIIFLLFLFELYPFINSSRAISLPFLVMAFIDLIYGKNKQAFIELGFSFIALFFALSFRGRASGGFQLIDFLKSLDFILLGILTTTTNLPTLSKTLEGIYEGIINISFSPLRIFYYMLYISPLPALFLGENIGYLTSLTAHFDFPIGITLDIVSESLIWFGPMGPLFFGLFWGYIGGLVNKNFHLKTDLVSVILFLAFAYFIIATNTYPTRHSSRFFIYSYTVIFVFRFFSYITKLERKKVLHEF